MSENGTRKGERTKKPPKYMQYDDADYGVFLTARTAEQKEKATTSVEINQVARVLTKFLLIINQKIHEYHQAENIERSSNDNENGLEFQQKKENLMHYGEHNAQKLSGISSAATKRGREGNDRSGGQPKSSKGEGKKAALNSRTQQTLNSNIQTDLDYHSLINQHIRTAYPNISNLSHEMLKGLDIPRQLLDQQNPNPKSRQKDQKGKNSQMLKTMKGGKEYKDELKPFKRQSYHVAIAYHIHLRRMKNSGRTGDLDPTIPARKLRESQSQ